MQDGKLLIRAFDRLWKKYRKRLADCKHEAGEESVHKLRISTRRLLSSIELLQALSPRRELRRLRKALKGQLDSFDDLRDTQVMLQEIASKADSLPPILRFLTHLQTTEQHLLAQTPAIIENIESENLPHLIEKTRHHLLKKFDKAHLKSQVLTIIDDTYRIAIERYQLIDISQPATIHRTRIGVKRFRYMLESGRPLLPSLPPDHLKRLHAYLTGMGEIQDSSVLILSLKHFFGDEVPLSVQSYYQHRHSVILSAYMAKREGLLQFWRPDADRPFPWKS
ncbi:CHAD domain-containing protein [Methylomonas sp. MgM2]